MRSAYPNPLTANRREPLGQGDRGTSSDKQYTYLVGDWDEQRRDFCSHERAPLADVELDFGISARRRQLNGH